MNSEVTFTIVNQTEEDLFVGVFRTRYAKPTMSMSPAKIVELHPGQSIDVPLSAGAASKPRDGAGPPGESRTSVPDDAPAPSEPGQLRPQPRETIPVIDFATNALQATIDVDLQAAIDSGRYFPSFDQPLAPIRPKPPTPPAPPGSAKFWLAIMRGEFTSDGVFIETEITTNPYEIKPGQMATISGSEWGGYVWNFKR